jgi:hypothetical protein
MATKNLARTVIEGGRTLGYKLEVSRLARTERCEARTFLRAATVDAVSVEGVPAPKRGPVYREFNDKLHPVYAFLDSRIGKSWDRTRSLIVSRFDPRSTPGRHVLYDHILNQVSTGGEYLFPKYQYFRYFVDQQGCLQKGPPRQRTTNSWKPRAELPVEKVLKFLKNRKVGRQGARFVWFEATKGKTRLVLEGGFLPVWAAVGPDGELLRSEVTTTSIWWATPSLVPLPSTAPFRATGLLTPKEEKFFLSIHDALRTRILEALPQKKSR